MLHVYVNKKEWSYNEFYLNPYTNNSRGVLLLFQNDFEYKVNEIYKGSRDNY